MKLGIIFLMNLKWKTQIINIAKKQGYSRAVLGNKRYLKSKGNVTGEEKRWIPNQIIQGTASYILKKSIIELHKKARNCNFLIPMHDAILLEVKNGEEENIKALIQKIFLIEYKKVCPSIVPSISFQEFNS